ncbi:hypothetical protein [Nonomuraea soli]|uniref:Uncharacterized protein n=1 Tax=Nonomuraea soli TaxID=1032476 RepID=A0A7W0CUA2_9ACTN|nr:hypothetical protein [Nonomuraea soli]MBA2897360.1 hypothetical protein [Nonomuraea soli]
MIAPDYLGWRPYPHAEGCARPGWEVLDQNLDHVGGTRELKIRIVCPQPKGCGVYHEWQVTLAPDKDDDGYPRSGYGTRSGPVERIGYGTAPIKVGDAWLHAGPPLLPDWADEEGPEYLVVTATSQRPRVLGDVLGVIGQPRRHGRQVKSRWWAVTDLTATKYGTTVGQRDDHLTSRAAAARWVLDHAKHNEEDA